jgi:hypothetical protein
MILSTLINAAAYSAGADWFGIAKDREPLSIPQKISAYKLSVPAL